MPGSWKQTNPVPCSTNLASSSRVPSDLSTRRGETTPANQPNRPPTAFRTPHSALRTKMRFLAPAALWFAAAIPVVILFYLLKRKRVVRLVSSTLLWQKFLAETQASAPFQRLRHNWLLILQLLMLALIIFALARPYFAGQSRSSRLRVVILDASASMQSTAEKPSRFEKARTEAPTWADGL